MKEHSRRKCYYQSRKNQPLEKHSQGLDKTKCKIRHVNRVCNSQTYLHRIKSYCINHHNNEKKTKICKITKPPAHLR